jgi:hypothetical protein
VSAQSAAGREARLNIGAGYLAGFGGTWGSGVAVTGGGSIEKAAPGFERERGRLEVESQGSGKFSGHELAFKQL